MTWDKVRQSILQISPWLAATLVSPVAGVAVKAISDAFGLTGDSVTPENLLTAISGATVDQLRGLRDSEAKHIEFMTQIGYTHLEQLIKYDVDDKNGARSREMSVKDNTPKVLAGLSVALFLLTIGFISTGHAPLDSMRDGFWLLVGAIIATYKDVYGYYFGSSSGSHTKDSTISKLSDK